VDRTYFIEFTYLLASVLFIFGLKGLSHPDTARRGMHMAEIGMLMAIVGTLMHKEIVSFEWIIAGLLLGSLIGTAMGLWVPMTAMPQRTALSHAFGALAASLVGHLGVLATRRSPRKFQAHGRRPRSLSRLTHRHWEHDSLLEAAGTHRGAPITFKGQNIFNLALFAVMLGCFVTLLIKPSIPVFAVMTGLSFLFGILLVIPIGSADMPVVMSLLNSYAGLASAATGFALSNNVLIIAGTLDGFSGFILSILMCKAMNRSILNVLFGAFGKVGETSVSTSDGAVREISLEDSAVQLAYARQVVFVPGYGMATAQAQHALRELTDVLEARRVTVKFAIHPVAGRMPGHMNVLLAEANIPYSQLYESDAVNPEFPSTDVAVVIGGERCSQSGCSRQSGSPISGMPIVEVDRAKSVIVLKLWTREGVFWSREPALYEAKRGRCSTGTRRNRLTALDRSCAAGLRLPKGGLPKTCLFKICQGCRRAKRLTSAVSLEGRSTRRLGAQIGLELFKWQRVAWRAEGPKVYSPG
jgi:NAD(P) transhydrogenase subunit beta